MGKGGFFFISKHCIVYCLQESLSLKVQTSFIFSKQNQLQFSYCQLPLQNFSFPGECIVLPRQRPVSEFHKEKWTEGSVCSIRNIPTCAGSIAQQWHLHGAQVQCAVSGTSPQLQEVAQQWHLHGAQVQCAMSGMSWQVQGAKLSRGTYTVHRCARHTQGMLMYGSEVYSPHVSR